MQAQHQGRIRERGVTLGGSLVYSLAGTGFYLLTQLGVLSGLSHLRGPVAVGEFGLALALTTPLFALANMGLRTAQAVDVTEQFVFADYGGVRLVLSVLAIFACLLAGLLLAGGLHTFIVVAVVAAAKAFESVSNLAYGAFQQSGRMELVARSYIVRGTLTLLIFIGLLLAGADIVIAFLAQLVVWAIVALMLDYPHASRLAAGAVVRPRLSKKCWHLLKKSAPLSGASFANNLQGSLPRLFLQWQLGLEQLGLFTAVGYFQRAGIAASNSVLHAIINRLAILNQNGNKQAAYRIIFGLAALFIVAGGFGVYLCVLFGDVILRLLFGESFVQAQLLLVIVSVSLVLRMISTLLQSLLISQQRFGAFFWAQIMTLIAAVPVSYYLIAWYGLLGAGYALVAAAIFRLVAVESVSLLIPRRGTLSGAAGAMPPTAEPAQ